jgi:acetoin utilization deacetylase AcuC-like enzyme
MQLYTYMNNNISIIYSPQCLEYKDEGHPESPERVKAAAEYLKLQQYEFVEPKPATEADLLTVHAPDLVNRIKSGQFFESDTPNLPGIYDYALLAAGAAKLAAASALKGETAFSLMRPPGHHAGKNKLGGFCYFNNIAIATQNLLNKGKRIAVIDIDCHHGNGTQDILLGQDNVIYISLHQEGIYPTTGYESEANCFNYPLGVSTTQEKYLEILKEALSAVNQFDPDIIAVSAGFDTFKGDPLTGMNLELAAYKEIAKIISELRKPVFAVLEGGYSQEIPRCIYNFLLGLK